MRQNKIDLNFAIVRSKTSTAREGGRGLPTMRQEGVMLAASILFGLFVLGVLWDITRPERLERRIRNLKVEAEWSWKCYMYFHGEQKGANQVWAKDLTMYHHGRHDKLRQKFWGLEDDLADLQDAQLWLKMV